MNTNLVKAVQKAIGTEATGKIADSDLLEIHRFITGTRYVEPAKVAKTKGKGESEAGFTNHGQTA